MNDYQEEQWDALSKALEVISRLNPVEIQELNDKLIPYLAFRQQVDEFLSMHFGRHCTRRCYENSISACCSKDGIITFWADVAINALVCSLAQRADLSIALTQPAYDHKCTYLGPEGCRWQIRPLMCALFLCDPVKIQAFRENEEARIQWELLLKRANEFRWPDRPVLFDWMESYFMAAGVHSTLMYIHQSPGLLRIKRNAGLL